MKEKTKLRVIQILCIVSLIITVFSIQRTYAKYYEKIDTKYDTDIKRWIINVNNSNIHREDELNNDIMEPVFRTNTHMNNNNTLVPGREGYFEFLIDYSKVDLKFRFEFDIEQLNTKTTIEGEGDDAVETVEDNHLEDFEIYGYSIVEDGVETITETTPVNDMSKLTQIIDPTLATDVNKKMQIRILFRWNDTNKDTEADAAETGMNNSEDTLYKGEDTATDTLHTLLNYRVKIKFTQQV